MAESRSKLTQEVLELVQLCSRVGILFFVIICGKNYPKKPFVKPLYQDRAKGYGRNDGRDRWGFAYHRSWQPRSSSFS